MVTSNTEKLHYVNCKGLNDILVEYHHGMLLSLKHLSVIGSYGSLEVLMNARPWIQKKPVFEKLGSVGSGERGFPEGVMCW